MLPAEDGRALAGLVARLGLVGFDAVRRLEVEADGRNFEGEGADTTRCRITSALGSADSTFLRGFSTC